MADVKDHSQWRARTKLDGRSKVNCEAVSRPGRRPAARGLRRPLLGRARFVMRLDIAVTQDPAVGVPGGLDPETVITGSRLAPIGDCDHERHSRGAIDLSHTRNRGLACDAIVHAGDRCAVYLETHAVVVV